MNKVCLPNLSFVSKPAMSLMPRFTSFHVCRLVSLWAAVPLFIQCPTSLRKNNFDYRREYVESMRKTLKSNRFRNQEQHVITSYEPSSNLYEISYKKKSFPISFLSFDNVQCACLKQFHCFLANELLKSAYFQKLLSYQP